MNSLIPDVRLREIRRDLDSLVKPKDAEVVAMVDEMLQLRTTIGRVREREGVLENALIAARDRLNAALKDVA